MAEYIEREAALREIGERRKPTLSSGADGSKERLAFLVWLSTVQAIRRLPSADVAPVRHGRWKFKAGENWYGGGGYECSACKYGYAIGAYHEPDEFTYCPNCGAKMDGGEI